MCIGVWNAFSVELKQQMQNEFLYSIVGCYSAPSMDLCLFSIRTILFAHIYYDETNKNERTHNSRQAQNYISITTKKDHLLAHTICQTLPTPILLFNIHNMMWCDVMWCVFGCLYVTPNIERWEMVFLKYNRISGNFWHITHGLAHYQIGYDDDQMNMWDNF